MARILTSLITAGAAIGLAAMPASADDHADNAPEMTKGEMKLAKMLEGREAGEGARCIRTTPSRGLTIIDGTAIVYRQGKTIWVNRTRHPSSLDDDDFLVIRKFGSTNQLCRLDSVTTRDRYSQFFTGVVMLEDFVPYRLADNEQAS